jgi:ABC-type transport system involved in multi-copper enzyme maturation permease subunit
MSTSRAIKPPRRGDTLLTGWQHEPDRAPSIVREEQPTFARVLALAGLFLILLGLIPLVAPLLKIERPLIEPGTGFVAATLGLLFVLFHAFVDRDQLFRRIYAYLGLLFIALAILLRFLPSSEGLGARFNVGGFPALLLGLILVLATVRTETEKSFRTLLINVLGGIGAIEILAAIGVGLFTRIPFLAGEGAVHLLMGLLYVGAFIGQQDSEDITHYAGLALGAIGLFAFAGGLIRSLMPESIFLVPSGLILMGAGLLYMIVAAGVCLDWPIVVLTRRELASYFYSPVAYLVLVGMILIGWFMFWQFVRIIAVTSSGADPRVRPLFEPILPFYIVEIIPVIAQIFVVPAITMRLVAEERRTGTMEVLLTAPVNEATVVISKFLAAWFFNLLTYVPWWVYLIALRYMGETEFDYRPLLSFNVTLLAVSAGFMAMGLFFSSLTRNQIIAAVLTFVGMIAHLAAYLIKVRAQLSQGDFWYEVLTYMSFLDVWWNSLEGVFAPRFLIFHVSLAVVFLYATVKVLEARKWT